LQEALPLVDHPVDHRLGQVQADNLAGRADMFRRRGDRKAAEGVKADGDQYRQQGSGDGDEKEGDLGV